MKRWFRNFRGNVTHYHQLWQQREGFFDMVAWRYFYAYYRHKRLRLGVYTLITSAQSLLVLPGLVLIRFTFDTAIPHGDIPMLFKIGLGLFLLRCLSSAISLSMRAFLLTMIRDAMHTMRCDLVDKLYSLSRTFYLHADQVTLHTQIVQDTERVEHMSNALLSQLLSTIVTGLALFLVLLRLNWWLLMAALSVLPLLWFVMQCTSAYVQRQVYVFQRAFEAFSAGIFFVLKQMDLTRVQGFEAQERARQAAAIRTLRDTGQGMAMSYAVHAQVQEVITGLAGTLILVLGGLAVATEAMSLGEFLAFYVAANMLNSAVNALLGALPIAITGNASLRTLHALSNASDLTPYHGIQQVPFTGHIALHQVAFRYADTPLLQAVSLRLEPHSNIAIIGPNGAGKSTILSLLLGFYKPDHGTLYAEGVRYEDLDLRHLRRSIGVVFQQPMLFAGSVLDNIAYGTPEATRAQIIQAAQQAQADTFIRDLPQGYDTQIGEGGVRLSGGESQRLAIARALLGAPKLLILDEPTNHLDRATITSLLRSLLNQAERPAILTISHDTQVIRFADEVYHLEAGQLRRETMPAGVTNIHEP